MHVDFDIKSSIKRRIIENVEIAIREYEGKTECTTKFGKAIIGYVSCRHPYFMHFMHSDYCRHPKDIYRPGNTVIVFFVPYDNSVAESNRGGDIPSKEWTNAFYDSMHLCMYLNRVICYTLDEVGRIHSGANLPSDWNQETHREEWSHKLAAYTAGLGRFGIGGSFHTEMGFAGRLSSVIVDETYAPLDDEILDSLDIESVLGHIRTDSKYLGEEDVKASQEAIDSCPGKAISKEGIDQKKCQEYCKILNPRIPSQEVCGKCFFYDR